MAPDVAAVVEAWRADDRLRVVRGRVVAVDAADGGLAMTIDTAGSRTVARVDIVVACVGPSADPLHDPLLRDAIRDGVLTRHPLGLGLDVDEVGRARRPDGTVHEHVWTVGSLRKGAEWESTAVPELRLHAAAIAAALSEARGLQRPPVPPTSWVLGAARVANVARYEADRRATFVLGCAIGARIRTQSDRAAAEIAARCSSWHCPVRPPCPNPHRVSLPIKARDPELAPRPPSLRHRRSGPGIASWRCTGERRARSRGAPTPTSGRGARTRSTWTAAGVVASGTSTATSSSTCAWATGRRSWVTRTPASMSTSSSGCGGASASASPPRTRSAPWSSSAS